MEYRSLGRTGVSVSPLCLGAMMFGPWGNDDRADAIRVIHRALDAGINFVDTADVYSGGVSEEIVGEALQGRRDDVVLATKFFNAMGPDVNERGGSRRWIVRAVEASLRRLQTDWIDLYQIHRPDPATDIEETLWALTDLVRAGKIRAFGCSTFPADQIVDAYHVAERRGLMRFRTEQPPYSLLARGIEAAVLPACQRLGMGVLTWSPLAWGLLSGKFRKDQPVDLTAGRPALNPGRFDPSLPGAAAKYEAIEELVTLAAEIGCSLPRLAVAFPAVHPAVTSVIIGPRTMQQLDDLMDGASLALDDSALDRIDRIVPPGVNLYNPDVRTPPELADAARRRRPPAARAAA
jgi:aryl-alcohol dehydrogenase-like predicted oxidoreductase